MSQLQINPTKKITVVFEGKEYILSKPKLGIQVDFEDKIEDAKVSGKGGTRVVMEYIAACGLPLEVVNELDSDQLQELLAALTPSKKN